MGIVFEQPDPMGYSPLSGVPGQVAQGNLDRNYLMQMQAMGLQAGHQAAQLQMQQQGQAGQMGMANARLSTQAAEMGQQGNVSEAQMFAANQQQSMQAQQQAAHAQQQQAEFSYQDNVRLSRLKNGLAVINNDPTLSDEEKQQYRMQLQTGIDPLQKQQEAAKNQMMQQQVQEQQQQGALQAAHLKAVGQLLTDSPDGVKSYPDGSKLVYDGQKLHYHPPPKETADPKGLDPHAIQQSWEATLLKVEKHLESKDPVSLETKAPDPAAVAAKMRQLGRGATLDEEMNRVQKQYGHQPTTGNPGQPPQQNQTSYAAKMTPEQLAEHAAIVGNTPPEKFSQEQIAKLRDLKAKIDGVKPSGGIANVSPPIPTHQQPDQPQQEWGEWLLHRLKGPFNRGK